METSLSASGASASTTFKPALWVPGDWNAFFGFGTNILVNLLTLSGLLRFVLKMPDEIVFKHILPAAGLMMCMSTQAMTPMSQQNSRFVSLIVTFILITTVRVPAS